MRPFLILCGLFSDRIYTHYHCACSDFEDQVFIWWNDETPYYFDVGETVRFRVELEEWHDQIPDAPQDQASASNTERKAPYSIVVSRDCP